MYKDDGARKRGTPYCRKSCIVRREARALLEIGASTDVTYHHLKKMIPTNNPCFDFSVRTVRYLWPVTVMLTSFVIFLFKKHGNKFFISILFNRHYRCTTKVEISKLVHSARSAARSAISTTNPIRVFGRAPAVCHTIYVFSVSEKVFRFSTTS